MFVGFLYTLNSNVVSSRCNSILRKGRVPSFSCSYVKFIVSSSVFSCSVSFVKFVRLGQIINASSIYLKYFEFFGIMFLKGPVSRNSRYKQAITPFRGIPWGVQISAYIIYRRIWKNTDWCTVLLVLLFCEWRWEVGDQFSSNGFLIEIWSFPPVH